MKKAMKNVTASVGLGLTAALVLSSCSGSASTGETANKVKDAMSKVSYDCAKPNKDTMTKVNVTAIPIVSNAAIYAGIDEGFFEKNGLELNISTVASIPGTIAAVQGGSADFAFGATVSTFQAIDKGIPLTIVAPFAGIEPGYWDKMQAGDPKYAREITALLVRPDSGIKTPGDLNGKSVAVSDARGQAELGTRYVIKAHGGDPDSVNYTVMTFADSINALMAGKIDAAYSTEPQMTVAEKAGYKIISWPTVETFHDGPTSAMISSSDFVLKHPETVARFNCAIGEAADWSNAHPDSLRQITAREQHVDPASLANAVVPYFYSKADVQGFQRFYDVSKDFGFLTNPLDIETVIVPQALR